MRTPDLFEAERESRRVLASGAAVLWGFALDGEKDLFAAYEAVVAKAPFRHMVTPGGQRMSVGMTNCGGVGWVSDRLGYRYCHVDPLTGKPWPEMPSAFLTLARRAAAEVGYRDFEPDACLINRYMPGARMTLHQDKDERDFNAPIVSVSLGLPAKFLFGGEQRNDRPLRIMLYHGDVVVWGGPARLSYHGVDTLKEGDHPVTGNSRINLTFRKAL